MFHPWSVRNIELKIDRGQLVAEFRLHSGEQLLVDFIRDPYFDQAILLVGEQSSFALELNLLGL